MQQAYNLATELIDKLAEIDQRLRLIPCPITEIAQHLDLMYDAHVVWSNPKTLGMLAGRVIFCSGRLSGRQSRWTIAHEIGHHLLDTVHTLDSWKTNVQDEIDANAFAEGLLTPHHEVIVVLWSLLHQNPSPLPPAAWAQLEMRKHTITMLVRKFKVGYQAMIKTLIDMGLVQGIEPWQSHKRAFLSYHEALENAGYIRCPVSGKSRRDVRGVATD